MESGIFLFLNCDLVMYFRNNIKFFIRYICRYYIFYGFIVGWWVVSVYVIVLFFFGEGVVIFIFSVGLCVRYFKSLFIV